jgi:hypothetical protein
MGVKLIIQFDGYISTLLLINMSLRACGEAVFSQGWGDCFAPSLLAPTSEELRDFLFRVEILVILLSWIYLVPSIY